MNLLRAQKNPEQGVAHLLLLVIILIGLVVGIYLLQTQKIFKSKASNNMMNAFEFNNNKNQVLNCDGSVNPPVCNTNSLDVTVQVKDLEELLK